MSSNIKLPAYDLPPGADRVEETEDAKGHIILIS